GISVCASCAEGRLEVRQYPLGSQPVGVTISHNHFGGAGQSDGVQDGAYGVVIDGNTFDGIVQAGGYTRHVDSIQLYGQSHTTISNNYMRNFTTAIMAPDGGDHEVVANNVIISPTANASAVQFGHQNGTTFTHNTVKNTDVHAWVGAGDATPNRSMVLQDNVMVAAGFVAGGCVSCTVGYNLFSKGATGTNALTATPAFAGGSNPTTYAGWALASGSPGKGNASDGTDRGINPGASIPGTPNVPGGSGGAGTGAGTGTSAAGGSTASGANGPTLTDVSLPTIGARASAFSVRWHMKPRKPRAGTRVVLTAPKTRAGGRKCVWGVGRGVTRRGCEIAVRFAKAGRKHITVRISDRSGAVVRGARDITIQPRAKATKKHA
ncbi:MAG TPA: right-handed parallel beta-helix repeat-containing protein, partial [Baekduia sp.]